MKKQRRHYSAGAAGELSGGAAPGSCRTTGRSSSPMDFKEFILVSGMTHVRTSPFLPAIERKDRALAQVAQRECIRQNHRYRFDDARRLVSGYVDPYNNISLNSATRYI